MFHDGGTRHADPPVPDFQRGRTRRLPFGVDPRDTQAPARITPQLRDSSLGHARGHSSRYAGDRSLLAAKAHAAACKQMPETDWLEVE